MKGNTKNILREIAWFVCTLIIAVLISVYAIGFQSLLQPWYEVGMGCAVFIFSTWHLVGILFLILVFIVYGLRHLIAQALGGFARVLLIVANGLLVLYLTRFREILSITFFPHSMGSDVKLSVEDIYAFEEKHMGRALHEFEKPLLSLDHILQTCLLITLVIICFRKGKDHSRPNIGQ